MFQKIIQFTVIDRKRPTLMVGCFSFALRTILYYRVLSIFHECIATVESMHKVIKSGTDTVKMNLLHPQVNKTMLQSQLLFFQS